MAELPPLKQVVLAGTWHIVVQIELQSENLEDTVQWLKTRGLRMQAAVEHTVAQRDHRVRVQSVTFDIPEVSGYGYDDVPQG